MAELRGRLAELRQEIAASGASNATVSGKTYRSRIIEAALAPEKRRANLPGVAVTCTREAGSLGGDRGHLSGLRTDPSHWANVSLPVSFGEHTGSKEWCKLGQDADWANTSLDFGSLTHEQRHLPRPRAPRAEFEPAAAAPEFALPPPGEPLPFSTLAGTGATAVLEAREALAVELARLIEDAAAAHWDLQTGGHREFDKSCACKMCRASRRGVVSARTLFLSDAAVVAAAATSEWSSLLTNGLDVKQVTRWSKRVKRGRRSTCEPPVTPALVARLDAAESIERMGWVTTATALALLRSVTQPSAVERQAARVRALAQQPQTKHSRQLGAAKAELAAALEAEAATKARGDKLPPAMDVVELDALIAIVIGSICPPIDVARADDDEEDEEEETEGTTAGAQGELVWLGELCITLPLAKVGADAGQAKSTPARPGATVTIDKLRCVSREILSRVHYYESIGVHAPGPAAGAFEEISLAEIVKRRADQRGAGGFRFPSGLLQLCSVVSVEHPQPVLPAEVIIPKSIVAVSFALSWGYPVKDDGELKEDFLDGSCLMMTAAGGRAGIVDFNPGEAADQYSAESNTTGKRPGAGVVHGGDKQEPKRGSHTISVDLADIPDDVERL